MSLYTYRKEYFSPKKKVVSMASYVLLTIGSLLLFWSFYPVISFEIYSFLYIKNKISTPVPNNTVSALAQANSILGSYNVFSNNIRDFTQASLWFPSLNQENQVSELTVDKYVLSIPRLNIKNAVVKVGGEDLAKSLVHYLPKSLPGQYGNVVVFGHSSLPQLYNEKDYKTIFTYLPSLSRGDSIFAEVDGVEYEYEVYDMFVVNPDQVSVLEQQTDASYLTLITCVPPGTYWKRLIVKAKLKSLPE